MQSVPFGLRAKEERRSSGRRCSRVRPSARIDRARVARRRRPLSVFLAEGLAERCSDCCTPRSGNPLAPPPPFDFPTPIATSVRVEDVAPESEAWDPAWDESWAKEVASWEWTKDGDGWKAAGTCPRCKHSMDHVIQSGTYVPADLREAVADGPTEATVTVRCNCNETHEGRPEAVESGCGPSANLTLPLGP